VSGEKSQDIMQGFQFSLRTLMIGVTVVCFTLGAVLAALEWRHQQQQRRRQQQIAEIISDHVTETFKEFANLPEGKQANRTYAHDDFEQYHLSTHLNVTDPRLFDTIPPEDLYRPGSVYVWPPGQWASTPEEAIQLLRDNL
jgi:hypothetical protein